MMGNYLIKEEMLKSIDDDNVEWWWRNIDDNDRRGNGDDGK